MRKQVSNTGFTLVELLVVLTVIAILAGISFPIYMHTKAMGKKTQCLSNLRQLSQAMLMYAPEYEGYLPPWTNDLLQPGGSWQSGNSGYPAPDLLHGALLPFVKDKNIWFCPTDPYAGNDIYHWGVYHLYSSYNFRMQFYPPIQLEGWTNKNRKISLDASSCPIIEDANTWSKKQDMLGLDQSLKGSGCQHFDGINIVYMDGHAKWEANH